MTLRPAIHVLPPHVANQIAAGEVVERPASVVKELVENALDAGATHITVTVEEGGLKRLVVQDDGYGLGKDDLTLAVSRHATSKIKDAEDLFAINSFGFRGEALPSIASVSRMTITSKLRGSDEAWALSLRGSDVEALKPAAHPEGTSIEILDLFFNTPARRKFLKTEGTEFGHIEDAVVRLALAHPQVSFTLKRDGQEVVRFDQAQGELLSDFLPRLGSFLGKAFVENAVAVEGQRERASVHGFVSLPTYNQSSARHQYVFVNGRPVKDRILMAALKQSYHDLLARHRHPVAVLFIDVHPREVDVNVHPAKSEVRFRSEQEIFGLVSGSVKAALAQSSQVVSTTPAEQALNRFTSGLAPQPQAWMPPVGNAAPAYAVRENNFAQTALPMTTLPMARAAESAVQQQSITQFAAAPMGAAVAQLHNTYIVAQTHEGMIVVDQHAAHERLVYEKLKQQFLSHTPQVQTLLLPEVVELVQRDAELCMTYADELHHLGLEIDRFGPTAVAVRGVPALLKDSSVASLVRDVLEDIKDLKPGESLQTALEEVLSSMACHGSIRAGCKLNVDEMNAILRQMEQVPNSAQCNHGRPTYIHLKRADIETLFGRR